MREHSLPCRPRWSVRLLACLVATLHGCRVDDSRGVTAERSRVAPDGYARARKTVREFIETTARPSEYDEVVVSWDEGSTNERPSPPLVLDVEWGNGHGGSLELMRFEVEPDETRIEWIHWRARTMSRDAVEGRVARMRVATFEVLPLIELANAALEARVERRRKPDAPNGGRSSSSSSDVFFLVRLLDERAATTREREFAGYRGSRNEVRYLPLEPVARAVREEWCTRPGWADVAGDEARDSHASDAFRRNRRLLLEDFHWWVMERSLELLAAYGNASALPALEVLAEHEPELHDRQRRKLALLLAEPERFLSGPAQDLATEE